MRFLSLLASLLLIATTVVAQKTPGTPGPFALTNARIVTVEGDPIASGTLVIRADTIAALGADVDVPDDVTAIDCTGLTVYPGLIDAGTRLGLVEIGSLSETRDFAEIGDLTPHMEALTAVNPNSVNIPVTRVNGVTTVLTEPGGGLLPGTAALIDLHGYTPDQMHQGGVGAVVLNFPSTGRRHRWDDRPTEKIHEEAKKAREKLDAAWDEAELYARIDSARTAGNADRPMEHAPAMEALVPVIRGDVPLLVKADKASDIRAALAWTDERGLTDRVILSGAQEGWRVADALAAANVPVLVGPVLSVPSRDSDRYDKAYANAGLLHDAGVTVALRTGEAENVRNLPYHAGFAAAYGLGREDALRAVTLTPAEIFGVDDRIGSLAVGKQANLFVTDGDPFETSTTVEHLFIQGFQIPLESRHTKLYDEFLDRTPGRSR